MSIVKDDTIYMERIVESIKQISEFVSEVDEDGFMRNRMMRDACLMQLLVIGENGGKVSDKKKKGLKK